MSAYRLPRSSPNLPASQHFAQHLVDQFNDDERLWEELAPLRRLRRLLRPGDDPEKQKKQDLADFSRAQPPKDCMGRVQ